MNFSADTRRNPPDIGASETLLAMAFNRFRAAFARTSIELRAWLAGVAIGLGIAAPHLLFHDHMVTRIAHMFG